MRSSNKNVRRREFRELFYSLPEEIRREARLAYRQFLRDSSHRALRRHPLKDKGRGRHPVGSFSVSINMSYRAVYFVDEETGTNVWYWIGSHAQFDKQFG